jgi:tetratricopeptide (TPR) repeat protein
MIPGGLFINYRSEDTYSYAALLHAELSRQFGSESVFLDSVSIPAGADYVEYLLSHVRQARVMLVVIGVRWLSVAGPGGGRRIDSTDDWIRRELVEAFGAGVRVIPVLTDDAEMPTEADLPQDLVALGRCQFRRLRHRDATADVARLISDLTGTVPHLSPVTRRREAPRQLPMTPASFTGRIRELDRLTRDLTKALRMTGNTAEQPGVTIAAITGTAGVGKTALAVQWAHQVADRFPDGQLYVNLRGFNPVRQAMDPTEAVRGFLDAMRVAPRRIPGGSDAQTALYRSLLAGRRMLVLLDNARDCEQVRPLLPGTPGCMVLVTSRNHLAGLAASGANVTTLDLFTREESWDLLASRLGPDRLTAEPGAVEEIITRCARLPLALAVVAARAAAHPGFALRAVAGELADSTSSLEVLTGDDPATDVSAVLSWSYRALSAGAGRLFRLLGLHPGSDISASAAASLAGHPLPTVRPLLKELAGASLTTEYTPGRYTFHDLLRAYAAGLARRHDPDQERLAASRRVLDHYLHSAHRAAMALQPTRDPITLAPAQPGTIPEHPADHGDALAWFSTEHRVLLAAVDHAAAAGMDTYVWQLAWALALFLHRRGHWHDRVATGYAAVRAATRLADHAAQAYAHRNLGNVHSVMGHFDRAHTHLHRALDLYRQTSDQTGQAQAHQDLAVLHSQQTQHLATALDHARQALDRFQTARHPAGQARALNITGWLHAELGTYHLALASCQQALVLHQELDDRFGQAQTWEGLGYAHHHLGHHTDAVTCYQHALDLYRTVGDRYGEAHALTRLADTHHATSDPEAARHAWQRALTILTNLDHPDADQLRTKLGQPSTSPPPTAPQDQASVQYLCPES